MLLNSQIPLAAFETKTEIKLAERSDTSRYRFQKKPFNMYADD